MKHVLCDCNYRCDDFVSSMSLGIESVPSCILSWRRSIGGEVIGPHVLAHWLGHLAFRAQQTQRLKWGRAPYLWKMISFAFLQFMLSISGQETFLNIKYMFLVKLYSAKKWKLSCCIVMHIFKKWITAFLLLTFNNCVSSSDRY